MIAKPEEGVILMVHFSPGWKLTVFTVLFMPVLIWLGLWQLEREREKIVMQRDHATRSQAAALSLNELDTSSDLAYVRVTATGQYDNERIYLLDNRIHQGQVGYEILNPFLTETNQMLLVNRGWIRSGSTRDQLPTIANVSGPVAIVATIHVPLDEAFVLGDQEESHDAEWPKVIQRVQMEEISQELGATMFPYTVRLTDNSPGMEQDNWPTVNMQPEKHRAYAVQWFAMAVALVAMYLFFGVRHPASRRD